MEVCERYAGHMALLRTLAETRAGYCLSLSAWDDPARVRFVPSWR
jgi:hypothetical protein